MCFSKSLDIATECLAMIVIPCNCWLFLLRIRAIPRHTYSRITLVICTFLWCATFTSFLILPGIRLTSRHSADAHKCHYEPTYEIQLLSIPFIALVAFDTAVATSVLVGLIMHNPHSSFYRRVKSTVLMEDMGPLCRIFLQSGYTYYLFVLLFIHCPHVLILHLRVGQSLACILRWSFWQRALLPHEVLSSTWL